METLISQVRQMLHAVTAAIFWFRRQNLTKAYSQSKRVLTLGEQYFDAAVKAGFSDSVELLLPVWKALLQATENGDEIQLADIYEAQLLAALYDIQNCLIGALTGDPVSYWDSNMAILKKKDAVLYRILQQAKENTQREYAFSWAMTGDPVLSVAAGNGRVQMNTAVNPWAEALAFVEENIEKEKRKYVVLGFGMGYHVELMAKRKILCREITVLENDLEVLRIAFMYRDLSSLLTQENLRICYADTSAVYAAYLDKQSEDTACIFWGPSIRSIQEDMLRETLENHWISTSSVKNMTVLLEDNFKNNIAKQDANADELKTDFKNKTMILVAAGPSLDNNMESLKALQGKRDIRIVCVGKIAAKLVKQGVRPDYLVMIDAKLGTKWQIEGLEESGIPLIYLSTAAATVVESYQGKRYIAFQQDFDLAEQRAAEEGAHLYQTGGSVSTFALDFGLAMGCHEIVCVGLDLGYPGGNSHASGVGNTVADTKSLRQAEAVGGGRIPTSKTLTIYRNWIEKRIKNVKGVSLINASGGARIHGMQEQSLSRWMD